jgi:hypothetical protein
MDPKVGDYIRKKNLGTFGRDHDSRPVISVTSLKELLGKKGGFSKWLINSEYQLEPSDIVVIDEDEARRIIGIWNDSGIISPVINETINTKCVREDNGKPKATYPGRNGWQRPLFLFKMKNPSGGFQAYECPECGKVHIGKSMEADNADKVKHISVTISEFTNSQLIESVGNFLLYQKEGNTNGYPWERFPDATRTIYDLYTSPLEGEGFSSWSSAYHIICMEIAKRKFKNEM